MKRFKTCVAFAAALSLISTLLPAKAKPLSKWRLVEGVGLNAEF
jgi:hypothetical protein